MSQSKKLSHTPTTVQYHLKELQMRIIVSVLALMVAGTLVFLFYAPILAFISSPIGSPLYYNTPAGSFTFVMRICFTVSLIITTPIIVYNLIMFIRPAFGQIITMKKVVMTTLASTALAVIGALFAFYVILPTSLSFFKSFQVSSLHALISADNYLGFVTNIVIMFVIVFQIPLLLVFIDNIKPLKPKKLLKMEKWVILGSLIIALIQPFTYDLVTSLLIALPIVVLYNISIIIVVARRAWLIRKERTTIVASLSKSNSIIDTESSLSLTELTYETLADELATLEKPKPISIDRLFGDYMDIKPKYVHPETVEPAPWVQERKDRRAALSAQVVHVFSDVRVSRVSTLR